MEHVKHLLSEFYDGELSRPVHGQVQAHLDGCADCRAELQRLEALSGVLGAYSLPDTLMNAETFRAQVALRLSHRRQSQRGYLGWLWYLVPLSLVCAVLGLLGFVAIADLLQAGRALLGVLGIDVAPVLTLPPLLEPATRLQGLLYAWLLSYGGLVWRLCLYVISVFVFVSYVGWVSVLWRSRTQSSTG